MERFRKDRVGKEGLTRYEDPIIILSLSERIRWWVYEHTKFTRFRVWVGDNYIRPSYSGRRHELYHQQQVEKKLDARLKKHGLSE